MLRLAHDASGVPQVINNLRLQKTIGDEDVRFSLMFDKSQQRGRARLVFQRLDTDRWLCDTGQANNEGKFGLDGLEKA